MALGNLKRKEVYLAHGSADRTRSMVLASVSGEGLRKFSITEEGEGVQVCHMARTGARKCGRGKSQTLFNNQTSHELTEWELTPYSGGGHQAIHERSTTMTETHATRPLQHWSHFTVRFKENKYTHHINRSSRSCIECVKRSWHLWGHWHYTDPAGRLQQAQLPLHAQTFWHPLPTLSSGLWDWLG